jgi:hypothetical protein
MRIVERLNNAEWTMNNYHEPQRFRNWSRAWKVLRAWKLRRPVERG